MSKTHKKGIFSSHAKSSAMLISVAIHASIIFIAISFVAVTVINKEDQKFESKPVSRPRMKLKKLQVPVKIKRKKIAPKLRRRIVAAPKRDVKEIQMPEITGVKGGLGNMDGTGLGSLGFGIDIMDLFGGNSSLGDELTGSFYDLKQTKRGKPSEITMGEYDAAIQRFLQSWNPDRFDKYFKAPTSKFAIAFMMPTMPADAAPEAFGVGDVVKPMQWLAYYEGRIVAPETGRYRFCGMGDDILYVRINKKLVLDACWPGVDNKAGWKSDDENNRKFKLGNNYMVIGDWMHLTAGKAVEMQVLLGERPGGQFCCQLLIEQDGADYRSVRLENGEKRPILPIFKLKEIPNKVVDLMKVNSEQATLRGPSFGLSK